jgi:hypothetical protein
MDINQDHQELSQTNHSLPNYSLRPQKSVVVGFCATSLTKFVENMCNICILE